MRLALLALLLLTQAPSAPQPEPYSQVEKLRVENMQLERVIVQRALDDWQKKALALKADLERARPGFAWNPDTDTWTPKPKDTK